MENYCNRVEEELLELIICFSVCDYLADYANETFYELFTGGSIGIID